MYPKGALVGLDKLELQDSIARTGHHEKQARCAKSVAYSMLHLRMNSYGSGYSFSGAMGSHGLGINSVSTSS